MQKFSNVKKFEENGINAKACFVSTLMAIMVMVAAFFTNISSDMHAAERDTNVATEPTMSSETTTIAESSVDMLAYSSTTEELKDQSSNNEVIADPEVPSISTPTEDIAPKETEKEETTKPVDTYFTADMDLRAMNSGVTAEELDALSAYYQQFQSFENRFVGKGLVFIEAGEKSGLDPLWIYTVARFESGFGSSKLAREKNNYFGIGAWDTNMSIAAHMGDDFYNGIVNGAVWIAEHYYEQGQTTMNLMNDTSLYPYHSYAPGNTTWVPTIAETINSYYKNWR